MSLKKFSKLRNNIYTYLGYKKINNSNEIDLIIDECLDEIINLNSFKYQYQEFSTIPDFLNKEPYKSFLKDTKGIYLVSTTLGIEIDKIIKKLQISNLTKAVIFDAVASAYLEYMADEYEKALGDNLTYRFCPGYQGSDIKDLKYIFEILKPEKIGITLLETNLMVPSKSMCGIIGIGKKENKSCKDCALSNTCSYLKEGLKCYQS